MLRVYRALTRPVSFSEVACWAMAFVGVIGTVWFAGGVAASFAFGTLLIAVVAPRIHRRRDSTWTMQEVRSLPPAGLARAYFEMTDDERIWVSQRLTEAELTNLAFWLDGITSDSPLPPP